MKVIRYALSVFGLLLLAASASAQLIPQSRLVPWAPGVDVGVPGGIPTTRTRKIDVTQSPYNADKTGGADASAAIRSAINAAVANDIVYLPAGRYRIDSSISISKSNITIRGDGDSTLIDNRSGSQGFFVGGDFQGASVAISGSPTKGATTITVASSSNFNVNDNIIISLDNDPTLPVVHVSGRARTRSQVTRVIAKSGNNLTISPALYFNLPANLNPGAQPLPVMAAGVGIEDLKIDGTNGNAAYSIWMEQAYGCWIKNVTSYMSASYHIFLHYSLKCEIRHSHVDNSKTHVANGSGLILYYSSANLLEDNIIQRVFPSVEINKGSSGNVIAYNLGIRSFYGDPASSAGASFDSNHDAHNSFDLYEGNIGESFQCDGYFGSTSEITVFRNWFRGYCPDTTQNWKCVILNRFSRNISVVGNVLGQTGYTWILDAGTTQPSYANKYIYVFGYPNMGNGTYSGTAQLSEGDAWADFGGTPGAGGFQELDLDVRATTILKGNYNTQTGGVPSTEALGSDTLPDSLYQPSKPSWFGGLAWPAFGPTNPNMDITAIPAGYRYINGTDPATGPATAPSNARISISTN